MFSQFKKNGVLIASNFQLGTVRTFKKSLIVISFFCYSVKPSLTDKLDAVFQILRTQKTVCHFESHSSAFKLHEKITFIVFHQSVFTFKDPREKSHTLRNFGSFSDDCQSNLRNFQLLIDQQLIFHIEEIHVPLFGTTNVCKTSLK